MEQEHENNSYVPSMSNFNQNDQGQQQLQPLGNQYQCSSVTFQQDQSSFNQYQRQASYNNNNSNGFNIFGQAQQQYPQETQQQPYQNSNVFGSLSGHSQPNLGFLQNGLDFSHATSQLFPPSHTSVVTSQLNSINSIPQGTAQQNLTWNSNSSNNSHQQLNVLGSNDHDEDDDGEFNPGEDDTNAERSSNSSDTNCDGESSSEGNHDDANFNLEEYLKVRDQL